MNKKYKEYLLSDKWKDKASLIKDTFGECVVCGNKKNLDTHHKNYENIYNEKLDDLTCLCNKCHSKIHGKVSKNTKAKNKKRKKEHIYINKNKKELKLNKIRNSYLYKKIMYNFCKLIINNEKKFKVTDFGIECNIIIDNTNFNKVFNLCPKLILDNKTNRELFYLVMNDISNNSEYKLKHTANIYGGGIIEYNFLVSLKDKDIKKHAIDYIEEIKGFIILKTKS